MPLPACLIRKNAACAHLRAHLNLLRGATDLAALRTRAVMYGCMQQRLVLEDRRATVKSAALPVILYVRFQALHKMLLRSDLAPRVSAPALAPFSDFITVARDVLEAGRERPEEELVKEDAFEAALGAYWKDLPLAKEAVAAERCLLGDLSGDAFSSFMSVHEQQRGLVDEYIELDLRRLRPVPLRVADYLATSDFLSPMLGGMATIVIYALLTA